MRTVPPHTRGPVRSAGMVHTPLFEQMIAHIGRMPVDPSDKATAADLTMLTTRSQNLWLLLIFLRG